MIQRLLVVCIVKQKQKQCIYFGVNDEGQLYLKLSYGSVRELLSFLMDGIDI